MKKLHSFKAALLLVIFLAAGAAFGEDSGLEVKFNGYGWVQMGMIMKHTDSVFYSFNKNWIQSAATQVTALVKIDEHWDGALGIGGGQYHRMQSTNKSKAREVLMTFAPYITQARFTYTLGQDDPWRFKWDFGYFPFRYNPDVKNLGLYLLRGPVYPAVLESGFEVPATLEIANIQGTHMSYSFGPFTQDLLLFTELEYMPLYDFSVASVSRFSVGNILNIGFGINFYHVMPLYPALTNPGSGNTLRETTEFDIGHPTDRQFTYIDPATWDTLVMDSSAGNVASRVDCGGADYVSCRAVDPVNRYFYEYGDSVWLSHQGTKVVGFFSFDPKSLFGMEDLMGKEDLKLYGEIGLIGVKDYPGIYDNKLERMPMMVGFNIPAFGFLDNLTFEVEYFKSPYRQDVRSLIKDYSPMPMGNVQVKKEPTLNSSGEEVLLDAPEVPYNFRDYINMHDDDLKWSVHVAKTIKKHVRLSAQVASDHFRPDGLEGWGGRTYFQPFIDVSDWYWMGKVLYFF